MPEIVNALLLRKDEVLLAKRSPARRAYGGCWSFPGGHVEDGESFGAALRRELMEEIGIVPTDYVHLCDIADPNNSKVTYHLYVVHAWTGDPMIRDREHSEIKWVSLAAAQLIDGLALSTYRTVFAKLAASLR